MTFLRRPVAQRAQDIGKSSDDKLRYIFYSDILGIWYSILEGIAKFSVITNVSRRPLGSRFLNHFSPIQAFIIALTSEFLPRILYYYEIGNKTLDNYVDYSLAKANVSSLNNPPNPSDYFKNGSETEYTHEFCRYCTCIFTSNQSIN